MLTVDVASVNHCTSRAQSESDLQLTIRPPLTDIIGQHSHGRQSVQSATKNPKGRFGVAPMREHPAYIGPENGLFQKINDRLRQ